jgi:hypothetical protein
MRLGTGETRRSGDGIHEEMSFLNRAKIRHAPVCILPVLICDSGQIILLINNNGLGFCEWVENPDLSKCVRNQESSPPLRRPPPPRKHKHVRSLDCSQSGRHRRFHTKTISQRARTIIIKTLLNTSIIYPLLR